MDIHDYLCTLSNNCAATVLELFNSDGLPVRVCCNRLTHPQRESAALVGKKGSQLQSVY